LLCNVELVVILQQPTTCRNPACSNRSKFLLDVNKSKFVDFQKVRIQEIQAELPRGCIPRRWRVLTLCDYSTENTYISLLQIL